MTVPIKKAGAYQLRAALRDESSQRLGSASQFIEVPDIKKNKLLLSGILLRGMTLDAYLKNAGVKNEEQTTNDYRAGCASREQVRHCASSKREWRWLTGSLFITLRSIRRVAKPNLKIQVRVFRNGEQLFAGNELSYDATGQADLKRLGLLGGIELGSAMAPGEYVLQIIVKDPVKRNRELRRSGWILR